MWIRYIQTRIRTDTSTCIRSWRNQKKKGTVRKILFCVQKQIGNDNNITEYLYLTTVNQGTV
jgi:hypothetical protein